MNYGSCTDGRLHTHACAIKRAPSRESEKSMELFLILIGMAVFCWMLDDGPQKMFGEWRKGQEAKRDTAKLELEAERERRRTDTAR